MSDLFPAPVYAETVLSVNFSDAQRYFLDVLLEIHYAHLLMLARQGILPESVARRCLEGLSSLDRAALATVPYDGRYEDLFFCVEQELDRACGADNAGRLHTARSRNDVGITQYRMRLRREILELVRGLDSTRAALLALARRHVATLIPGYTHTQPAQPTTLAHYLLGAIELFERDIRRCQAAFATVNRSPLGACAITTTGFPIDREFTAALLGFEGLQLNSYGAIAATDYLAETAGAVATAMVNLGRLVQDLLLWSTAEFGFLRLSDRWVQVSSIMPQKRNPVALEHTRSLAGKAFAEAQAVFGALHNTPFGDIVDSEDDLQPLVQTMVADAIRALHLFAGLIADCEVNAARMAERARSDFLTVTELADTLVRSEGLSFRQAHDLVSQAVRRLGGDYSEASTVDCVIKLAPAVLGRSLRAPRKILLESLDPEHFVTIRRIPGGPAPEPVQAAIRQADTQATADALWLREKSTLLTEYPARIREACHALVTAPANR